MVLVKSLLRMSIRSVAVAFSTTAADRMSCFCPFAPSSLRLPELALPQVASQVLRTLKPAALRRLLCVKQVMEGHMSRVGSGRGVNVVVESAMTKLVAGGTARRVSWLVTGGNNATSTFGAERRWGRGNTRVAAAAEWVTVGALVTRAVVARATSSWVRVALAG